MCLYCYCRDADYLLENNLHHLFGYCFVDVAIGIAVTEVEKVAAAVEGISRQYLSFLHHIRHRRNNFKQKLNF